MKAKELRIGNLVYLAIPLINGDTDYTIIEIGSIFQDSDIIKSAKPIPLTEEWLLKFGLSEKEDNVTILTNNFWGITIEYYENKWTVSANNEYTIAQIENVHQLQNLYFALTGEELTIK